MQSNETSNYIGKGLNDDSFDDEFRLLESTLTDFKEDDCKAKDPVNDSEKHSLDLKEMSPNVTLKLLSEEVSSIPLKLEETEIMPQECSNSVPIDLIRSTNVQCTPNVKISDNFENVNAQCSPLPTTQSSKCNESSSSLSLSIVSSPESLKLIHVSLNSVSSCGTVSGIMQSSSNTLCSVQENIDINYDNPTQCKPSAVDVALCDSSFIESQEGTKLASTKDPSQSYAEMKLNGCMTLKPEKKDFQGVELKETEIYIPNKADITETDSDLQCKKFQLGETKSSGIVIPVINCVQNFKQNNMMMQSDEGSKKMSFTTCNSLESNTKLKESSEILTLDGQLENKIISACITNNHLVEDNEQLQNEKLDTFISSDSKNSQFFCSTPIASNLLKDNMEDTIDLNSEHTPLSTNYLKSKMNLKRTNLCLERIEEVDEIAGDSSNKRLKIDNPTSNYEDKIVSQKNDPNISLSMPCFEPPAKSILKKWHQSSLSRDSFLVLDECGGSDLEETLKPSQESVDHTSGMDDFEVACKSLAEELMMSSSDYETLEKYHSKVHLDCQIDNKKFDEVLQELTLNYELDEKSLISKMKPIDQEESMLVTRDQATNPSLMTMEESLTKTENKKGLLTSVHESSHSSGDKTILAEAGLKGSSSVSMADNYLSIKKEDSPETSSCQYSKLNIENDRIVSMKEEQLVVDEEDVLLDEDVKVEQKQYVYFEYVSSDPKENEDNYNPEWQKLGKLTTDEERYKAVRDRWRSLVPPDPNRDLTCRQWRKKNNKPPLNIPSLNNNKRVIDGNEKNQLCTAVFERKIANILHEEQMRRIQTIKERNVHFEELAVVQDKQQRNILLRGCNAFDMAMLQKRHIQECVMLKNRFDARLDQVKKATEESVKALKKACDQVLSFQKFYKGVGDTDKEVWMYMSDIQIEELMETEEMLDRYPAYYQ